MFVGKSRYCTDHEAMCERSATNVNSGNSCIISRMEMGMGRCVLVDVAVGHAAEQTFAVHVPVIPLYITASTPKALLNCS